MSWKYRVLYHTHNDESWYAIHSVHYLSGEPTGWSESPAHVQGESNREITGDMTAYMRAMYKPVLEVKDNKLVEKEPPLWPNWG